MKFIWVRQLFSNLTACRKKVLLSQVVCDQILKRSLEWRSENGAWAGGWCPTLSLGSIFAANGVNVVKLWQLCANNFFQLSLFTVICSDAACGNSLCGTMIEVHKSLGTTNSWDTSESTASAEPSEDEVVSEIPRNLNQSTIFNNDFLCLIDI